MLPPLADLDALSERLGITLVDDHEDPLAPDGVRALAALQDASSQIRSATHRDWLDEQGELDFGELAAWQVDELQSVCLAVAYRAFRNPDGTSQSSVGDVSVSFSREGAPGAGAAYLTRDERRRVRKAAGIPSAGSIEMTTHGASGAAEEALL